MKSAEIKIYAQVKPTCGNCALLIKHGSHYRCGAHYDHDIYIHPYMMCGNKQFFARLSWLQRIWISLAKYIF